MRKFKVKVELMKEYEIEIDENKINKEVLDEFERYFYNLDEEDDRVKSLANDYCRLRAIGFEGNIEGYGYVLEDSEVPLEARIGGLKKEDINNGINFKTIDDGECDPYIEVEEIS